MAGEITPVLSPDGRRLVFQRRTLAAEGDLYVLDLKPDYTAAGPPRQLTHEGCCLEAPSWTRDGRDIVFVSWKSATRRLARIGVGGGSIRFDPTVPAVGMTPRVAPDGRLIFHDSAWVGSIFRLDLKEPGAAAKRLIASSRRDGSPAYSPDGKWIVFSSDRGGSHQLWICDNEGHAPRQFTHLEGVSAWYPVYSSDGRWIAFEGRRGNDSDIYLANSLTGRVTPLLQEQRAEQRPRWSSDGRRLYFASDSTGRYEIWSVGVDEKGKAGAVAHLTHQGGYIAFEAPDGRLLYYAGWTSRQIGRISTSGGPEEQTPGVGRINRYPAKASRRAKTAALSALEIDDSLPDPHCALGFIAAVCDFNWVSAEAHFRRALDLQPDRVQAHVWLAGHVLAPVGHLDEAAAHARRSCELDRCRRPR